jgi:signal transduction histidine kinase
MEAHAKLIVRRGQSFIQWIQRDISERLQLEEMRSDLISMIFHDLRSPLGNVITSLETVSSGLPVDRTMEHALLTIAQRSAGRMSRLVDSLLDLRRLEAGRLVLQRDDTDLRELIDEVRELTLPMATVKHTTLLAELPDGLPSIAVDSDMIRRVLINLVENAVKYTPVRGRVTISATVEPAGITLTVSDTGPGIPPADQGRVFGMFTRLQRDRGAKGLGLGLAFCRLAVQAHGGRIWVQSEPGAGSNFHIALPYEAIEGD